jgi:hypothetical protein
MVPAYIIACKNNKYQEEMFSISVMNKETKNPVSNMPTGLQVVLVSSV